MHSRLHAWRIPKTLGPDSKCHPDAWSRYPAVIMRTQFCSWTHTFETLDPSIETNAVCGNIETGSSFSDSDEASGQGKGEPPAVYAKEIRKTTVPYGLFTVNKIVYM